MLRALHNPKNMTSGQTILHCFESGFPFISLLIQMLFTLSHVHLVKIMYLLVCPCFLDEGVDIDLDVTLI